MLAQRRPEEVGQVRDRLLGESRIGAGERGDRVHAVEQEMRPDSRLQRPDAALGLGLDVGLPLVRHVEVAKREPACDRADDEVAKLHLQVDGTRRQRLDAQRPLRIRLEPPGAFGHERGDEEGERERDRGAREHVEPGQETPRRAPDGRGAECGPQQE